MSYITNINLEQINLGKAHFAELIKILFYKKDSVLIELLDLDDDEIFLDPLLYAYFNDENAEAKTTLEQLIYGYIQQELKPTSIPILFDENNIAYISRIGYFKSDHPIIPFHRYNFSELPGGSYSITSKDDVGSVNCTFYPILFADDEKKIELVLFQHPLLKPYFSVNRPGYANQGEPAEVQVHEITMHHAVNIKAALSFLNKNFNKIYNNLVAANRKFFVFNNPECLCFTHQNLLGISFFSSLFENSRVFFIEEILHQGSHNIFNTMYYDKYLYYKINFENERLGDHLKNPSEHRTLFNVFHGLVTVCHRLVCYRNIVENELLFGEEMHELYGRFCDQFSRLNSGLELLDTEMLYTAKGKALFSEMRTLGGSALEFFEVERKKYDLSNQPTEFDYKAFVSLNAFESTPVKESN
jgi:hypothetical protein